MIDHAANPNTGVKGLSNDSIRESSEENTNEITRPTDVPSAPMC